jgi:hypothetical protein
MGSKTKVNWVELMKWDDSREMFFVEAEKDEDGHWTFSDRSTMEVVWYARPSSPELIARAELELQRRNAAGGHRDDHVLEDPQEAAGLALACMTHA